MAVKRIIACLSLVSALIWLGACSGGGGKEGELGKLGKDEKSQIKVMYYDANFFFNDYGNTFALRFPNIEIEVVGMQSIYQGSSQGTPEEKFDRFIEENKPDVLLLSSAEYERLAQNGKLFALDSVIEQDQFDTQGIHAAILKVLRELGGGKLYGLAPEFSSSALYYNIDLFREHGVEPPRDSMSWEEVFELARRFPTDGDEESRIYGLSMDVYLTLDNLVRTIGAAQDLRLLSPNGSEFNIASESWKKVFRMTIDAAKSGSMYVPADEDRSFNFTTIEEMYEKNLFIMGRSAMAVKYSYEVSQILQAKEQLKNVKPVNWGMVTAPVDPDNRNQSSYFNLGSVFAVNVDSANLRAAWEFVKYVNGDEFAKLKSKSSYGNLMSRTEYNADKDGRSLEPFYKLEPKGNTNNQFAKAPQGFYEALSSVFMAEIDEALADRKTADEAIEAIQEQGQEALIRAKRAAEQTSSPE